MSYIIRPLLLSSTRTLTVICTARQLCRPTISDTQPYQTTNWTGQPTRYRENGTIKQTYCKHGHAGNLPARLLDYRRNVRLSQTHINFHFTGSASAIADDAVLFSFHFFLFHIYKTYILGGGKRTKEFAFKSKGMEEYPLRDYYHLPHRKLFKVDPEVCACNLQGTIWEIWPKTWLRISKCG